MYTNNITSIFAGKFSLGKFETFKEETQVAYFDSLHRRCQYSSKSASKCILKMALGKNCFQYQLHPEFNLTYNLSDEFNIPFLIYNTILVLILLARQTNASMNHRCNLGRLSHKAADVDSGSSHWGRRRGSEFGASFIRGLQPISPDCYGHESHWSAPTCQKQVESKPATPLLCSVMHFSNQEVWIFCFM